MTNKSEHSVDLTRLSLLVRWRPILFPIEQSKFLSVLPENGYVLSEGILDQHPAIGSRSEVTGIVAKKGGIALAVDSGKPGLQLEGTDVVAVLDEFDKLEALLREIFRFESKESARFYEVDAQALVWSPLTPLDAVRNCGADWTLPKRIGEIIKHPVTAYSLKVSSPDRLPVEEDWYELYIEPSSRSPEAAYFTYLVFRKPDRIAVWEMAGRVPEIFRLVAQSIEER